MGFWIFMLAVDLLIPLTMIGFGKYFLKTAPKEINAVFGYRTSRSMKNRMTWEFAHNYIGRLWFWGGLVMLPATVIAMMFFMGKDMDTVGIAGAAVCCVQIVLMVGSIIPAERALKRNFDDYGRRI